MVVVVVEVAVEVEDTRDNKEAANSSKAEAEADKADVCLEGRATCNNHNSIPTTSLRLVESKPTGSTGTTTALQPRSTASA